jgi:hypothetical protein
MIGSGEAESRAVASAVKGAVGQVRLDAGVNITGLLIDIDSADDVDCRQYLMCWHLTRVLRPSLTEIVPPAVVRSVVHREEAAPPDAPHRSLATPPSPPAWRAASTTRFLNVVSASALVSSSSCNTSS